MKRSKELDNYLNGLKDNLPQFEDADFSDISWSTIDGENALHVAIIRNEYDIAKELVGLGIEINARGEHGHTPLHEAASFGYLPLVKLLVENGADVHALNEGVPPFTLARYSNNDEICNYLGSAMKAAQSKDQAIWAKAQIEYLKREIERIENQYGL